MFYVATAPQILIGNHLARQLMTKKNRIRSSPTVHHPVPRTSINSSNTNGVSTFKNNAFFFACVITLRIYTGYFPEQQLNFLCFGHTRHSKV